jgi:hypothetical protein
MTSWRDTASTEAQDDLDGLLNSALSFAQQQLAKHAEFYPFALAVNLDGETVTIGARPAPGQEHPNSADVIQASIKALTERNQKIRAGAIAYDVRLPTRTDAIRVDLEHRDGQTLSIVLPYTRKRNTIEYGQLSAHPGNNHIWAS